MSLYKRQSQLSFVSFYGGCTKNWFLFPELFDTILYIIYTNYTIWRAAGFTVCTYSFGRSKAEWSGAPVGQITNGFTGIMVKLYIRANERRRHFVERVLRYLCGGVVKRIRDMHIVSA